MDTSDRARFPHCWMSQRTLVPLKPTHTHGETVARPDVVALFDNSALVFDIGDHAAIGVIDIGRVPN